MERADQTKLDHICLRIGNIHSWQKFMLIGSLLSAGTIAVSVPLTYWVMQDMGSEALNRALILSVLLPLGLVTLAWTALNKILMVMTRTNLNLRRAADIDSLTCLSNRAAFCRRGRELFERTQRLKLYTGPDANAQHPKTMALIMVDVDHFKQINDQLGHLAGDQALRHISTIISKCCRQSDMPSRWGGEEFAILLEDADRKAAEAVAERIRQLVYEEPMIWENKPIQITLSAGVTEFCSKDQKLEDIVLRADLALYHAKASGRNRVHAPQILVQDLEEKQGSHNLLPLCAKQQAG